MEIESITLRQSSLQSKNRFMTPSLRALCKTRAKCFSWVAPFGTKKTLHTCRGQEARQYCYCCRVVGNRCHTASGWQDSTCHVQIPIDLESVKTPVSRNSDKGHVLKDCSLIVWDERTMANRKAVEAEDRTLQDIRGNEHLMGSVMVSQFVQWWFRANASRSLR
ncbi:hypothetical protein PYW08_002781 [Mythimna loreyi]|uniref:Uncharacterized protein n=3 Tax=Mythimna loreyi TaxID=667449 RepID=A0ACC2QF32_9NEOP|nr:hypothetical protein PYW08_007733 [Mythimna loreyi]KAJ8714133.1 hypothetical protein PYW08_007753 [Mythimna loreyi]KAJ8718544.1 hypothetical protein PYW08_002781 [Mythimna loreyi]